MRSVNWLVLVLLVSVSGLLSGCFPESDWQAYKGDRNPDELIALFRDNPDYNQACFNDNIQPVLDVYGTTRNKFARRKIYAATRKTFVECRVDSIN